MPLVISDEDIKYAEQILFKKENVFDEERKEFIRNLELIDLQAVPGSGKTTALLAKLIALSKYHPFKEGCGILVISHTNAAVNQIKQKIGNDCPNIFKPPNFVGTIQSFVNTFLAYPFFEMQFGFRPDAVDANYYKDVMERRLDNYIYPSGFTAQEKNNVLYYLRYNSYNENELVSRYRFDFDTNNRLIITQGLNGLTLDFKKPVRGRNYSDFNQEEKERIKKWLVKFKVKAWRETRIIHYDDAYFFAKNYMLVCPLIKEILRKRFTYVFVDEMQDMDIHQIKIIDEVFFDLQYKAHIIQRIGDKNQAIFSYDVKLDDVWEDREKVLSIKGSLRLSKNIADKVTPFALNPIQVNGLNEKANDENIFASIIVYDENTIENVIPRFQEIIKSLSEAGKFPDNQKLVFKAIGWRKESDEERKTIIRNYYPQYNSQKRRESLVYACFEDYLLTISKENFNSKDFVSIIINVVLHILDDENEFNKINNLRYNSARLKKELQQKGNNYYEEFKSFLYEITGIYLNGKMNDVKEKFKELALFTLQCLNPNKILSMASQDFIQNKSALIIYGQQEVSNSNTYKKENIEIEVGTVHSVKGETHTGTLYLETYYQADGVKSFESQRLIEQMKGNQIGQAAGIRTKQSSKMVYVGFSRPTHLLCFSAHINRINEHEEELEKNGWRIDKTLLGQ